MQFGSDAPVLVCRDAIWIKRKTDETGKIRPWWLIPRLMARLMALGTLLAVLRLGMRIVKHHDANWFFSVGWLRKADPPALFCERTAEIRCELLPPPMRLSLGFYFGARKMPHPGLFRGDWRTTPEGPDAQTDVQY